MSRRTSSRGSSRPVVDVLLAALSVAVIALAAFAVLRDVTPQVSGAMRDVPASEPTPSAPVSPAPVEDAEPASLAVIGDGMAVGEQGWPALLATQAGLRLEAVEAEPGSGYLAGTTFIDRATALTASGARPDVVVVAGSRADSASTGKQTLEAATQLYAYLAAQQPQAQVVVIGPAWPTWAPPAGDPNGVRQGVKSAANDAGLAYTDPQAEPWFTDANRDLLDPDGVRLTPAGASYVAGRIAATLPAG